MALDLTVVIPAFNRADTIARAVASALAQRPAPPAEVIVVDDASADATADRAEQAGARVIRLPANRRAGNARNVGARHATTTWLTFLDSDDELFADGLGRMYPYASTYDVVSGLSVIREHGRQDRLHGTWRTGSEIVSDPRRVIFPGNPFPASGGIIARAALCAVGGYSTTLRYGEDLDLWIRLVERAPALLLDVPTLLYHRHAGSKSQDSEALAQRVAIVDAYRDREWWSRQLSERHAAALSWMTFRDLIRGSAERRTALPVLAESLRTPTRAAAVGRVILRNLTLRYAPGTPRRATAS